MTLDQAKQKYRDWVIIWHQHQLGGQLRDRWMWLAEKNGEVIDYHRKDKLIENALAEGEKVVVLALHRRGEVTAKEVAAKG